MKFNKKSVFAASVLAVFILGGTLVVKNTSLNNNMLEERVAKKDIKTYYTYSGEIKPKNSQVITLNNSFTVDEILIKEGQEIKDGQTLFRLSSGSKVTSDIDGQVSEILVNEDVKYDGGIQVATITNYDALQVEIKINEHEASSINIEDEVDVYINALDKTVKGKVVNLSRNATVTNGVSYFRGVIEIEDTKDILVGMSTEVKIVKDDVQDVKTISMNAIEFDSENQPYVYIKNKEGKLVQKTITVGVNDGVNVEVKSGLKDGEAIYYSESLVIPMPFEMIQTGGK